MRWQSETLRMVWGVDLDRGICAVDPRCGEALFLDIPLRTSPMAHHDEVQVASVNDAAKLSDGGNAVLLTPRRKMAEKMGVA